MESSIDNMKPGDHFTMKGLTLTVITGKRKGSKYTIKRFDPITFTITIEDPWYYRVLAWCKKYVIIATVPWKHRSKTTNLHSTESSAHSDGGSNE